MKRVLLGLAALLGLFAAPSLLLADNLEADGDEVASGFNAIDFGEVCTDSLSVRTSLLYVVAVGRGGSPPHTGPNTFQNGAVVTVSPSGTPTAGLAVTMNSDDTISLPPDWQNQGNNVVSADSASAEVTFTAPSVPGPFAGSVGFVGSGLNAPNSGPPSTINRSTSLNVTADVISCAPTDAAPPVTSKAVGEPKFGDDDYFVTGDTEFTLTCDDGDDGSGCDETFYKFDPSDNADCSTNSYNPYSAPFTLSGDDGEKLVCFYSTDVEGNEEEAQSQLHYLDNTAPVFDACPAAGPFILNSGSHAVGPISVGDGDGSGVDNGSSTLSGSVDTGTIGAKTVTFTAVDNLGNSGTVDCTYSVIFDFDGFFSPLKFNGDEGLNQAKGGSAIPLKFSLNGDQGLDIITLIKSVPIACDANDPVGDVQEASNPGGSSLSYDPDEDQYNYVWKTEKSWSNTCRELKLKLADGTVHTAQFKFK